VAVRSGRSGRRRAVVIDLAITGVTGLAR
jgi:hypothetical protein